MLAYSIANAMLPSSLLPVLRRLVLVLLNLVYTARGSSRVPSLRRGSRRARPKRYSLLYVAASPCCVLV